MRKLFISYRSDDAQKVDKIAADLNLLRKPDNTPCYVTWQDKKNIPPASPNWWDAIVDALIACDAFVFFMSHASLSSEVCRAELDYAHRRNRPIIPVVLEGEFHLNPRSGKYDIAYWDLVPAWMKDIQLLFYTGAAFFTDFQAAIDQFQRQWPRDINVLRPSNPTGKGNKHAIYATACECAGRMAFVEAEKYFHEFVRRNDEYYADLSAVWLEFMPLYQDLLDMHAHRSPKVVFQKAWDNYCKRFPNIAYEGLFDPKGLGGETSPQIPRHNGEGLKPQEQKPVQEQKLSQEQLPPQEQKPTFSTQQTPPLPTERGLGGEVFHNADWKPVIITFPDLKIPDMPFCLVPKGTFQMGEGKETHPQTFDEPFYIAQYPVTNAQWSEAVKAGVVKEPANVGEAWKWYKDPKMANTPVVGVNWYQCQSFAAWMGCRLPTEREWEYAARGVDNLIYPWGNEFIADNVVYRGNSRERPHVVTEKPNGASWVGASHLSGNVWEWCSSLYGSYPYVAWYRRENLTSDGRRILRGGSWGNHVSYLCAAHRDVNSPDDSYLNGSGIGFRCARSYLP